MTDMNKKMGKSIVLSDWMRKIPDSWTLAQLSIPGTHDSGTFKLSNGLINRIWAKTQDRNFTEQMLMGVRFFDIRGRVTDDNTIVLHHGNIYLEVTLHQFINTAKKFLKDHPSETIIMSLKEEYKAMPGAEDTFVDTFEKRYFKDSIFLKKEGNITMGNARGKIVLLRRYAGGKMTGGYRDFWWADNKTFTSTTNGNIKVTVQDQYDVKKDVKKDAINNMLIDSVANSHNPNHIHINFTSVSSGGTDWSSPKHFASILNSWTAENVKKLRAKAGWVIMDYVGDEWNPKLYWDVIDTNFYLPNRYKIKTALNGTSGVDVSVNRDQYGNRNVHLYNENPSKRHQWDLHYDSLYKAYQIHCVEEPSKVLAWNGDVESRNVFITENKDKKEYYWILENVGNDYCIIKNYKNPDLVLDIQGGKTNNNTNIQVHERNETNAQKFKFKPVIIQSVYKIKTALNGTSGVDVSSAGDKNVHLHRDNSVTRSHWMFQYDKHKDAYQIVNIGFENEVMAWNDFKNSRNVFVTKNQHKDEHYWILEDVGEGYYLIKNYKKPDLVLDIDGGKTNDFTNIQVYKRNGTNAQKFKLFKVDVDYATSYHQQNPLEQEFKNKLQLKD
ncbi:phosphatidylinositol-specific phospholipase C domain-containing protein [Bacillus cereus]|nr:phosphatidylinositol-specific phospholipase C domain-containing protein [Bacillus cereus]